MKIIRFEAENIKKLKVISITPKGHVIQLSGRNGSGKTSALDSILYALAGTEDLPSQPIRKGADKGGVYIDLGEYRVMRKFTSSGNVLMVEGKNGARFKKPQELLNSLFGDLTFDPLAFTRMKPDKQAAELQRLTRLEIDPSEIDAANKVDYEERKEVNREIKALEARIAAISFVAELPKDPIDITALLMQVQEAGQKNAAAASLAIARNQKEAFITETRASAARIREQIAELEQQIVGMKALAKSKDMQAESDYKELEKIVIPAQIDTASLVEEIQNARATNSQIDKRTQKEELEKELAAKQAAADALSQAMKDRLVEKETAISKAEMPIPGLGFADGEVTFNDLPLNQASGAEQLRVSLAIAMASNPQVRIIRITDGSLLDEDSMAIVKQMAIERDYQIWIEVVDTSGKVGIVFEDGEVIANNDVEDVVNGVGTRPTEEVLATSAKILRNHAAPKAKKGKA